MKLTHALTLAAALVGGAAAYAGDGCPACPEGAKPAGTAAGCDGCCPTGGGQVADKEAIQQIDTEALAKIVAEKDATKKAVVFDVNSAERYAKGHVPGSKNITVEGVTAASLPTDKAAKLVFYCGGEKCPASTMAAKRAVALGYTNVWVYKAGIAGWEAAKQATEPGATPS